MSRSAQSSPPRVFYRLVYWDDMVDAPPRRYGPAVLTSQMLDQMLELTGERHPVHKSDRFAQSAGRKRRVIPSGFLQSFTSGWLVQHGLPGAVVGLQPAAWEYKLPLYPDEPLF